MNTFTKIEKIMLQKGAIVFYWNKVDFSELSHRK